MASILMSLNLMNSSSSRPLLAEKYSGVVVAGHAAKDASSTSHRDTKRILFITSLKYGR
jgi:hypothetical protein